MRAEAYKDAEPYIFVSYSHSDPEVREIIQEIMDNRYRVWYDERIKSGDSWGGEISQAIKNCTQFLVFISRNSIDSENVKDEIFMAKNNNRNIQIVYLNDCDGSVLTGELELWLGRVHTAVFQKRCPSYNAFLMAILRILNENTQEVFHGQAKESLEGKYTIQGYVSRGAMGRILKGKHKSLSIPVLIKQFQLPESITSNVVRQGLREEIRTYCALSSCPYVPAIYDVFEDEGETYVVQSYVDGQNVETVLGKMEFSSIRDREDWCVEVVEKTAHALKYFHCGKKVLVHRDIKPKNLMINSCGDIYVVDLGTCMEWTPELKKDEVCIGTLGYAAPEQFGGMGASDPRTDIYALGMTLFHLLTGKSPQKYGGSGGNPKTLRYYNQDFHPGLEEIILKATASNRRDRYQNVDELITALQSFRQVEAAELISMTMRSERRIQSLFNNQIPSSVIPKTVESYTIPAPPKALAPQTVVYRDTVMETTILSDVMHSTVLA